MEELENSASVLSERVASLESDLKSSEDLLQEKLSALAQYEEDSAQLNEEILSVKEKISLTESEKRAAQSENTQLQALVGY